jgi:hypothetical protein
VTRRAGQVAPAPIRPVTPAAGSRRGSRLSGLRAKSESRVTDSLSASKFSFSFKKQPEKWFTKSRPYAQDRLNQLSPGPARTVDSDRDGLGLAGYNLNVIDAPG